MSDKKIFEEKYRELAKNFKDYKYFRGENKKSFTFRLDRGYPSWYTIALLRLYRITDLR